MSKINTSDLKSGMCLIMDGEPYIVVKAEFVSPGKGQAFTRTKMKGLKSAKVIENSFKSGEMLETAEVTYKTHSFLFADGDIYTFMNPETYDQIEISGEILGDSKDFLKDGMDLPVQFLGDDAVAIVLPKKMTFKVVDTAGTVKGDTKNNATKPAELDNGVTVSVPMFVNVDDELVINTETREYCERA